MARPRGYENRFTSDEMKDTPHFKVNFFYPNKGIKPENQFLQAFVKDLFFVVQRTNLTSFPKKTDTHFW